MATQSNLSIPYTSETRVDMLTIENYNDWVTCETKTGSPGVFLEGKFARPLGHELTWHNTKYTYTAQSDLAMLSGDNTLEEGVPPASAKVTHLSHYHDQTYWNEGLSHQEHAVEHRIKGGKPPIKMKPPDNYINPKLFWWAIGKTDSVKAQLKTHYENLRSGPLCNVTDFDNNLKKIGTSGLFGEKSVLFEKNVVQITVPFKDLMDIYRKAIMQDTGNEDIGLEFRILGTFRYKMEVQHTVLVCPAGLTDLDASYPKIDIGVEADYFLWIPYCTIDGHTRSKMWGHVAFAFLLKKGTEMVFPPMGPEVTRMQSSIPGRFEDLFEGSGRLVEEYLSEVVPLDLDLDSEEED